MNLVRFPIKNTNSPLTCVFKTSFENQNEARDGVQSASGALQYRTDSPHKQGSVGGNAYIFTSIAASEVVLQAFPNILEFVVAGALRTYSDNTWRLFMRNGSVRNAYLEGSGSSGDISLHLGLGGLIGSSLPSAFVTGKWNWINWWGKAADAGGFGRVRVGNWVNLVLDVSGDTIQSGADNANQLELSSFGGDYDDIHVFARSMYFRTGTGTLPTFGQTLTGGTSGATALITNVYNDGADGVFFVTVVNGTFQVNEPLSAGGWTGVANNALGNDEASLWVPELYDFRRAVTGDAAAGWDNSTGGDHFSQLADGVEGTFVDSETPNQVDVLDTTLTLPAGAIPWVVGVAAMARTNGTSPITKIQLGANDGVSPVAAPESALNGTFEKHTLLVTKNNPNTGVPYTPTELAAYQARLISKA